MKKSILILLAMVTVYMVNGFYPRTVEEPVVEKPAVVETNNIGRIETLDCVEPLIGNIETLDVVEVIE